MKPAAIFLLVGIFLASCGSQSVVETQSTEAEDRPTAVAALNPETLTPVITPTFPLPSTVTLTLVHSGTPTPDTRLTAHYWREWATVPELSERARTILQYAIMNSELDLHIFSKVGDCQMTSGTFLGGFANGKYPIPEGYKATVKWFSVSMESESITAANGLGINSVLNPLFGRAAGYSQCGRHETPLDCELRT